MPIPSFTDDGMLPEGIHPATLEEVLTRFGGPTPSRQAIAESLGWAVDAARLAGVARFIVDGSFIDAKPDPNDVDCVMLFGTPYPLDPEAARQLEEGFPYVHCIFFENQGDFEGFYMLQFGTDRLGRPRGLVEVQW